MRELRGGLAGALHVLPGLLPATLAARATGWEETGAAVLPHAVMTGLLLALGTWLGTLRRRAWAVVGAVALALFTAVALATDAA